MKKIIIALSLLIPFAVSAQKYGHGTSGIFDDYAKGDSASTTKNIRFGGRVTIIGDLDVKGTFVSSVETKETFRNYDTDGDSVIIGASGFSASNSNAAGNLMFHIKDGGTTFLAGDSSGNVGIGTATPQELLDVRGQIFTLGADTLVYSGPRASNYTPEYRNEMFMTPDGDSLAIRIDGTTNWLTGVGASGWTDDGTNVRLTTSSDKVGIGTASPGSVLEVLESNANKDMTSGLTIRNDGTGSAILHFRDNGVGDLNMGYDELGVFSISRSSTGDPATDEVMVIETNGIGFGTAGNADNQKGAPVEIRQNDSEIDDDTGLYLLNIGAGDVAIHMEGGAGAILYHFGIDRSQNGGAFVISETGAVSNNLGNGQFFHYRPDSNFVGLGGDTTPDAALEVSSAGALGGAALMVSSDADNDGDLMTVMETGDVGLGTSSPRAIFSVESATPELYLTDTDVNVNRTSFATASDSAAFSVDVTSEPIIKLDATDGDDWQMSINTSDAALFQNAASYNFDADVIVSEAAGILDFSGATSATIQTSNASMNTLTLGGAGQTNNENITFDFESSANTIEVGTGTGVTSWDFNALSITASSFLEGANAVPNATDNLSFFSATTSAQLAGVISDETGSGATVFGTSPTITTSLSQDGDVADAGYLRLQNAATIGWEASPAGTDVTLSVDASEIMQASGTFNAATLTEGANAVPNATDNLSFFSSTTSSQLAGVISDETGSGVLVLDTAPTFTTSITTPTVISTDADPADAGVLRLGNAESIAWEASPAGTDVTISVDASEILQISDNVTISQTGGTDETDMTTLDVRNNTSNGSAEIRLLEDTGSGTDGIAIRYRSTGSSQNDLRFNSITANAEDSPSRFKIHREGGVTTPTGTLTLGAGVTTFAATSNVMVITGDGGGNTIATITLAGSGDEDGMLLTMIFVDANVTITDDDTHGADSVDLSAAFTSADDTVLQIVHDGSSWYEVSRSSN